MLEWTLTVTGREHHALLGVEVVHLSARNASWADYVSANNARTGRHDTFTHLPAFDPSSPIGFLDERVPPPLR